MIISSEARGGTHPMGNSSNGTTEATTNEDVQALRDLITDAGGLHVEDLTLYHVPGAETIWNVNDEDGQYLYTLTITKTPGY